MINIILIISFLISLEPDSGKYNTTNQFDSFDVLNGFHAVLRPNFVAFSIN